MPKLWRVILGALSFAPLIGFCLLLALSPHLVPSSDSHASNPDLPFQIGLGYVAGSWVVIIGAIILALTSPHIRQSQRISWALALFLIFKRKRARAQDILISAKAREYLGLLPFSSSICLLCQSFGTSVSGGSVMQQPNSAPHRDGREAAPFGQSSSAPARGRER